MKTNHTIRSLVILAALLALTACNARGYGTKPFKPLPPYYSGAPIEGWVVDAETKTPIEGVIVIAVWELSVAFGTHSTATAGHIHVEEVLTDEQGHYRIAAWGPKKRPGKAYMGRNDPLIVIFKPDYDYLNLYNAHGRSPKNWDRRYEEAHDSSWDGKTVELKRFEGNLKQYMRRLSYVNSALSSVTDPVSGAGECDWVKIPQMILAFDKYDQMFAREGITTILIPDLKHLNWKDRCGPTKDIYKGLNK